MGIREVPSFCAKKNCERGFSKRDPPVRITVIFVYLFPLICTRLWSICFKNFMTFPSQLLFCFNRFATFDLFAFFNLHSERIFTLISKLVLHLKQIRFVKYNVSEIFHQKNYPRLRNNSEVSHVITDLYHIPECGRVYIMHINHIIYFNPNPI